MKSRDYLWCLVNQILDDEEELGHLCPACRARAEEERCPACGVQVWSVSAGVNTSFDMERFQAMKGERQG